MSPIQTCFSFPSDDCDNAMHEDSSEFLKKKKKGAKSNSERRRLDAKVQKMESITLFPTRPEQRVCEHG